MHKTDPRGGVWCQLAPPLERICQVTAVIVLFVHVERLKHGKMNFQRGAEQKDAHLGIPAGVADLVMRKSLEVCYGSGHGVRGIEGCLGWAIRVEQAEGRMNFHIIFQRSAE